MDYTSLIKEVDIPELVKALRFCARWHRADDALANAEQAAAAIEALMDAEKTYLAELAQCHENLRRAAETRRERDERIEALQAEVEQLKAELIDCVCNGDLD